MLIFQTVLYDFEDSDRGGDDRNQQLVGGFSPLTNMSQYPIFMDSIWMDSFTVDTEWQKGLLATSNE